LRGDLLQVDHRDLLIGNHIDSSNHLKTISRLPADAQPFTFPIALHKAPERHVQLQPTYSLSVPIPDSPRQPSDWGSVLRTHKSYNSIICVAAIPSLPPLPPPFRRAAAV